MASESLNEYRMSTIGITGGTGFVGTALAAHLGQLGHQVIVFTRSPKAAGNIRQASWNPAQQQIDTRALAEVNAMVHLAGAGVMEQRWTAAYKKEIIESRVDATDFLIRQLKEHAPKCNTLVAASATGYYGPDRAGTAPFQETAPPCDDFLGTVCRLWEAASLNAQRHFRTVILRFGIVLGRGGGAYQQFTRPMKLGLKPILGGGSQKVSWIHLHDIVRLTTEVLDNKSYSGIYNAVAPVPVTHRTLMNAIARKKDGLKIPAPVPAFVLRAMLGESSVEILKSCTVSAEKLTQQGFQFNFPAIEEAVEDLEHS